MSKELKYNPEHVDADYLLSAGRSSRFEKLAKEKTGPILEKLLEAQLNEEDMEDVLYKELFSLLYNSDFPKIKKIITGVTVEEQMNKAKEILEKDVIPRENEFQKRRNKEELEEIALEMIFQITGKKIPEDKQCEQQGDADYQIAMHSLRKVNN